MMIPIPNLPTPVKAGLALLGGATVLSALFILAGGSRKIMVVLVFGTLLIGVLLALYYFVLKMLKRKRGARFENELGSNASASRRDDLRKRFLEGVEKFRRAGKDLYELPWFVMVGESGSGKTEAIRHSQLRFPPGLQDKFQGAGGTMDMHWWFTDDAVILDTAGRLIEQADALSSAQWEDFLKLLRTHRKNCPINGLILVVPADKLIRCTAEDLEQRAGKIAEQFAMLQEKLDIRFPVYAVVSKCDLINGFREFFDNIRDPELQHQILGWSDPESIDEPFDGARLQKALEEQVVARVEQRRFALLQDPRPMDRDGSRTDEIDTLFDFPDSLEKVVPRIRRYLEIVFGGSGWSAKPLFLRGVYFTSSMREGSALDEGLADALGVAVDELPEGRAWEKERAFFLHDVFREKMFRERGLVTRASNSAKSYRTRKLAVLCAGLGAVVVLGILSWHWGTVFKRSIGVHSEVWKVIAGSDKWGLPRKVGGKTGSAYFVPIAVPEYEGSATYDYANGTVGVLSGADMNAAGLHKKVASLASEKVDLPGLFAAAGIGVDFEGKRAMGRRVIYENGVLAPLLDGCRAKLIAGGEAPLDGDAEAAIRELLLVEMRCLGLRSIMDSEASAPAVDVLAAYLFGKESGTDAWKEFSDDPDRGLYRQIGEDLYRSVEDWQASWAAEGLSFKEGAPQGAPALRAGVERLLAKYCSAEGFRSRSETFDLVDRIREGAARCLALEDVLIGFGKRFPDEKQFGAYADGLSSEDAASLLAEWRKASEDYAKATADLNALLDRANVGETSLREFYVKTVEDTSRERTKALFDVLPVKQGAFSAPAGLAPAERELISWLTAAAATAAEKVKAELLAKADELDVLRDEALRTIDLPGTGEAGGRVRALAFRGLLYGAALGAPDPAGWVAARARIANLETAGKGLPRIVDAGRVSRLIGELNAASGRTDVVRGKLDSLPSTAADLQAFVANRATRDGNVKVTMPFTSLNGELDSRYHPGGMKALFDGWRTAEGELRAPENPVVARGQLVKTFEERSKLYDAYFAEFADYWLHRVPALAAVAALDDWQVALSSLGRTQPWLINKGAGDLCDALAPAVALIKVVSGDRAPAETELLNTKIEGTRAMMTNPAFLRQCSEILTAWTALAREPVPARAALLRAKPGTFVNGYMLVAAEGIGPSFLADYWQDLGVALIDVLGRAYRKTSEEAMAELRKLQRFPLGPVGGASLTPDELLQAATLIASARPESESFPQGTLGAGSATGFPTVDRKLAALVDPQLAGNSLVWLESADRFVRLLAPEGRKVSLRASIMIPAYDVIEKNIPGAKNGHTIWRSISVSQGAESGGPVRPGRDEAQILAGAVPGDPLRLEFIRLAGDTAGNRELSLAAPWGALQMLFADLGGAGGGDNARVYRESAKRLDDGKSWLCTFRLYDLEGTERLFMLKVVFDRPLPELEDWPGEF